MSPALVSEPDPAVRSPDADPEPEPEDSPWREMNPLVLI